MSDRRRANRRESCLCVRSRSQTNQHVTALLDVLEDNDLYLRYYTIQLLTVLLMNKSEKVRGQASNRAAWHQPTTPPWLRSPDVLIAALRAFVGSRRCKRWFLRTPWV